MTERPEPGSSDQPDEIDLRDDLDEEPAGEAGKDLDEPDGSDANGERVTADEIVARDAPPQPARTSWAARAVTAMGAEAKQGPEVPQPAPDARIEPLAVAALVLGIASVLGPPLFIPVAAALGLYLVRRARQSILRAGGALRGWALTRVARFLCWLGVVLLVLAIVLQFTAGGAG